MRTENILEQYRKGDFHTRLNLYLEHRDLRPEFMHIDLDMPALPKAAVSSKNGSKVLTAFGSIKYRIARFCSQ